MLIDRAFDEDVGTGDLTANSLVEQSQGGESVRKCREEVAAGGITKGVTGVRNANPDGQIEVETTNL